MANRTTGTPKSFIDNYMALTLSEWLSAIGALYEWHEQLHHLLSDLESPHLLSIHAGFLGNNSWSVKELIQLQEDLLDLLTRLERDMSRQSEELSTNLLIKKLRKDTRLMTAWNHKIRRALQPRNAGTA